MNFNELRIGNWVGFIEENRPEPYWDETTIGLYELELAIKYPDFFKAIPITEEWLLEFGFYETSRYGKYLEFNISQEQSLRLPICKHSEKDFWYVLRGSVKIKYVHQLQNLYFALTGEELTIKLPLK